MLLPIINLRVVGDILMFTYQAPVTKLCANLTQKGKVIPAEVPIAFARQNNMFEYEIDLRTVFAADVIIEAAEDILRVMVSNDDGTIDSAWIQVKRFLSKDEGLPPETDPVIKTWINGEEVEWSAVGKANQYYIHMQVGESEEGPFQDLPDFPICIKTDNGRRRWFNVAQNVDTTGYSSSNVWLCHINAHDEHGYPVSSHDKPYKGSIFVTEILRRLIVNAETEKTEAELAEAKVKADALKAEADLAAAQVQALSEKKAELVTQTEAATEEAKPTTETAETKVTEVTSEAAPKTDLEIAFEKARVDKEKQIAKLAFEAKEREAAKETGTKVTTPKLANIVISILPEGILAWDVPKDVTQQVGINAGPRGQTPQWLTAFPTKGWPGNMFHPETFDINPKPEMEYNFQVDHFKGTENVGRGVIAITELLKNLEEKRKLLESSTGVARLAIRIEDKVAKWQPVTGTVRREIKILFGPRSSSLKNLEIWRWLFTTADKYNLDDMDLSMVTPDTSIVLVVSLLGEGDVLLAEGIKNFSYLATPTEQPKAPEKVSTTAKSLEPKTNTPEPKTTPTTSPESMTIMIKGKVAGWDKVPKAFVFKTVLLAGPKGADFKDLKPIAGIPRTTEKRNLDLSGVDFGSLDADSQLWLVVKALGDDGIISEGKVDLASLIPKPAKVAPTTTGDSTLAAVLAAMDARAARSEERMSKSDERTAALLAAVVQNLNTPKVEALKTETSKVPGPSKSAPGKTETDPTLQEQAKKLDEEEKDDQEEQKNFVPWIVAAVIVVLGALVWISPGHKTVGPVAQTGPAAQPAPTNAAPVVAEQPLGTVTHERTPATAPGSSQFMQASMQSYQAPQSQPTVLPTWHPQIGEGQRTKDGGWVISKWIEPNTQLVIVPPFNTRHVQEVLTSHYDFTREADLGTGGVPNWVSEANIHGRPQMNAYRVTTSPDIVKPIEVKITLWDASPQQAPEPAAHLIPTAPPMDNCCQGLYPRSPIL